MDTSGLLNPNIISMLKDSILVSTNISNKNEIVFDFISQDDEEWSRRYLYIRNSNNFYFQRYKSSFQRNGLINLHRIQVKPENSEWVKEIKNWKNTFTKETGIEFQLYNGSIFRFVGTNLAVEESFVEGPIESISQYINEKPDSIEESKAKIILNESFSQHLVKSVKTIILKKSDASSTDDDLTDFQIGLNLETNNIKGNEGGTTIIDPELEEALDKIENLIDKELIDNGAIVEREFQDMTINDSENKVYKENLIDLENDNPFIESSKEQESFSLLDQLDSYANPTPDDKRISHEPTDLNAAKPDLKSQEISIGKVGGVTKTNKASLEAMGYNTVEKLAKAKITKLISINGIGKATARKIIQNAKNMIEE